MITVLARRSKIIAWFYVTVFYLQLVLVPVVARASEPPLPWRMPVSSSINDLAADNRQREDLNAPVTAKLPKQQMAVHNARQPEHPEKPFTTGPSQPEMQSFQSVNANNLVDLFTGDFSYNIPLLDVGGYPVNLHYQSGVTMDQEASWVGLGWNINPGVISRNMRGLPDDFQGETVTKTISIKPNKTFGVNLNGDIELLGKPLIRAGVTYGVFHNTYKGWGIEYALNATIEAGITSKSALTGGLSINSNSQTGVDISPSIGFKLGKEESKYNGSITIGTNYNSRTGIQSLQMTGQVKKSEYAKKTIANGGVKGSAAITFSMPSYTPTISVPYTSKQVSFTAKVGTTAWTVHPSGFVSAYSSVQEIEGSDKVANIPAYGYMNFEKAGDNRHVLLDYNREKDIAYSDKTPHIAVPIYTYDVWNITGEGTGGMFRPYRGDIGYIYDHTMATKSKSGNYTVDLGFGGVFHAGVDLNTISATTNSKPWESGNDFLGAVPFRDRDTTFENVYFKNPSEKATVNKQYLREVGDDYLMRVKLSPDGQNQEHVNATRNVALFRNGKLERSQPFNANALRTKRDKRSQVISWLNAAEARAAALDTTIHAYGLNSFPATSCNNYQALPRIDDVRKPHHLSEITVLNEDGRRYVYGIPVYNKKQVEVTMATDAKNGNTTAGLTGYTQTEKSTGNKTGKDGYFNREDLPGYSHSFLLSGILSPDYSDLTADGITEDDNGEAVKFNYTRVYDIVQPYKWRAPYDENKAAYNEGLKTDSRDEKGSFTYGEREVWYLNSVESKTMIATFVLDADRKDGLSVKGEDGGQDTQKLYSLKEINLYTKADYLKYGPTNAKPVKTVHLEYSNELCTKNPGSLNNTGKLTLKKVWFSYNKNFKGKRNPYVFTYNARNPEFNSKAVDRWGNYKDPANNPGGLNNADYSYTLQHGVKSWDSIQAATYAAPWTLSEVKLPSGAKIKATYESDDYAYVQNKRAMQFFNIAGFGASETGAIVPQIYPGNAVDYRYVFVQVDDAVNNKADVARKYLEGVTQLFCKLAVNMPADKWGKGFEVIPVYAEIEDFGVRSNNVIWIKVKPINGVASPFVTAALQFLRLNLYSKAYPFSEPGDNLDIGTIVNMMISVASNVIHAFDKFNDEARRKGICNTVQIDKSFVRLDNPQYKKLGGGLRVKKVEIYDNWKKMTGQQEAVYGQTYDYSTTLDINGTTTRISSGVATYEPMIGNDENPFRVPTQVYTEKVGASAPTDYLYSEEPFAETFFPSPSVGYSKVHVQTINKDKKSANGYQETEYYTSRDFPVFVEYTPIDGDSKKTYNPTVQNFFKVDARHYVTLSQGFKIELNDMNGKLKSQATYSQNDLVKPISYTYNYYRLKNDAAGQPKLSNAVAAIDSANGRIDTEAEIGREVELMVDVREQRSVTHNNSIETNFIYAHPFPPIFFGVVWPVPNREENQYRAIAVLKIVNRYGILDSVIHTEKGSTVTTRDLVYDAETGDVLLTQTNNEFDDPIYNLSYPAHWAYSGLEPAYKNIGTVLKHVNFRGGILVYQNGQRVAAERYFESGDEVLVWGLHDRTSTTNDHCADNYYLFGGNKKYKKLWAVDASRGVEQQKGIYFIDENGIPFSGNEDEIKIIRSGKRNMAGTPVGAVTSLRSPVIRQNGLVKLAVNNTTGVIAASAARFKDLWKVDSTLYRKDTTVLTWRRVNAESATLPAVDNYTISDYNPGGNNRALKAEWDHALFEASSYNNGGGSHSDNHRRSWLQFDFNSIPRNSIISLADLALNGCEQTKHANLRSPANNSCYLERVKNQWVRTGLDNGASLSEYFWDTNNDFTDVNTRVTLAATTPGTTQVRDDLVNITNMAQAMLFDFYNSNGNISSSVRMRLVNPGGDNNGNTNRLSYNTQQSTNSTECGDGPAQCTPAIRLTYYPACADGSYPQYYDIPPGEEGGGASLKAAAVPLGGYFCHDQPFNTSFCKSSISDTAVNFYRFGILGNWRMDRAYTYYGPRMQTDPAVNTNIRKDGEIKDFAPYWSFNDAKLTASTDTGRWVWNSEMIAFNNKGSEIENHDPLNRYNAGQYGYNKTLPIAVAQNAKNREVAFDGFEDYGYRTDNCKTCVINQHVDLGSNAALRENYSHTGLYSLQINGNSTVSKTYTLGTGEQDESPVINMKEDSVAFIRRTVRGMGNGLGGSYIPKSNPNSPGTPFTYTATIDYNKNGNKPIPEICCGGEQFWIGWSGYIQPRYTGVYKFWATGDEEMIVKITVNGQEHHLTAGSPVENPNRSGSEYLIAYETQSVTLQAGELYLLTVDGSQVGGNYQFKLEWQSTTGEQLQGREVIPESLLYTRGSDLNAIKNQTVTIDTTWCVQFKAPNVSNKILKRFSPIKGKKIVVGAWVKQEGNCPSGNYDQVQMEVAFDNGAGNLFQLKPSGNIIEGWQRIEDTLTIPANANNITVKLNALSATTVYFDDIRIQPFNANMKSFVYHPVNLRLMAELDENNYATYYEYDDEGTLTRVKKETEQGIKTLKETRSALLKEPQQ